MNTKRANANWSKAGAALFLLFVLVALLADVIAPYGTRDRFDPYDPPSRAHLLGTNDVGYDILTELVHGSRVSMLVGFGAALIATLIGLLIGLVSGYFPGLVDEILMGATDVVLMIPRIPLIIILAAFLRPSFWLIGLVIGLMWWTSTARIVRSKVLQVRDMEYVTSARCLGFSRRHILFSDILPNIMQVVVPKFMLTIAAAMISETSLSFLGLGDMGMKSWGMMLNFAFQKGALVNGMWWWFLPPGMCIMLVVVAVVLMGFSQEEEGVSGAMVTGDEVSCLETRDLTVQFSTDSGLVTAVDHVSLSLCGGGSLALMGETGCGKSTLALAVLGLLSQNARVEGEVLFEGDNLLTFSEKELSRVRGERIAAVLQNPSLSLNPVYAVGRQVAEVFRIHRGTPRKEAERQASQLLARLGIPDAQRRMALYPFQFSEGMNQRVLIAAGVALDPRILIADEPTKGMDQDLKREVVAELKLIQKGGRTQVFLIAHDMGTASELCERIAVMYAGEILEESRTEAFFAAPLHPYAQALLDSLPERGFQPVPGDSPSVINPPPGCRFHPRCPKILDICIREKPALVSQDGRKVRCHLYR